MSFNYFVKIDTDLSATSLAAVLLESAVDISPQSGSATVEDLLGNDGIVGTSVFAGVYPDQPEPTSTAVSRFGIHPNMLVWFRPNQIGIVEEQEDEILSIVTTLLHRVNGDVLFTTDFDPLVWVLRKNGITTLTDDPEIWDPVLLSQWTQPYELVDQRIP